MGAWYRRTTAVIGPLQRLSGLRLAPDGRPRPHAPFGNGPLAARVLRTAMTAASHLAAPVHPALVEPLAVTGGTIEWLARPQKRAHLAANLSRAVRLTPEHPRVRSLVLREMQDEARRSADLLWAIARPDDFLATTRVNHLERATAVLGGGRGVVLAGAHVGGWELAAPLAPVLLERTVTAVVTDDWLAWAADGARRMAGLRIAYVSDPLTDLVRRLRRGEVVVAFVDIIDGPRTCPVQLFGDVVHLPAGAVVLARLGGAPLVPFVALRDAPRRWRVDLGHAIEPPPPDAGAAGDAAVLQRVADAWQPVLEALPDRWAAVEPLDWQPPSASTIAS
jgi:lauroyl/myristoyl acyltransferase